MAMIAAAAIASNPACHPFLFRMISAQKITKMGRTATRPEAARLCSGLVGCIQGMDEYRQKSGAGALPLVKYLDGGKLDGEVCSVGLIGGDMDGPFVQCDDPLGHGQAQTETADISRILSPVKRLKDLVYFVWADHITAIDHPDIDLVPGKAEIDCGSLIHRVFAAVLDQVLDRDEEQLAIAENDKILFIFGELTEVELDAVFGIQLFYIGDDLH